MVSYQCLTDSEFVIIDGFASISGFAFYGTTLMPEKVNTLVSFLLALGLIGVWRYNRKHRLWQYR
jgi:hypothetical protein